MLRSRLSSALSRRAICTPTTALRLVHSSPSPPSSSSSTQDDNYPPPPPPPPFLSAATIYPFILLSAITSLALNLSHQRTARQTEGAQLKAQVTVLETLLGQLRTKGGVALSAEEQEEIERELELVGLGRGKGKKAVEAEGGKREETSWTEVFFGKKGKGYEEKDETDWEKVFHEADEAEKKRAAAPPVVAAPRPTASSPIVAARPPPPPPPPTNPSSTGPAPPIRASGARPVYL